MNISEQIKARITWKSAVYYLNLAIRYLVISSLIFVLAIFSDFSVKQFSKYDYWGSLTFVLLMALSLMFYSILIPNFGTALSTMFGLKLDQRREEINQTSVIEPKKLNNGEREKSKFQRDLELAKLQICADVAHNKYNNQVTMWSGLLFTIVAVMYTLYSAGLLQIGYLFPLILFFGFVWGFQIREARKEYGKDLIKINADLDSVQHNKHLSSLANLLKLDDKKETITSET